MASDKRPGGLTAPAFTNFKSLERHFLDVTGKAEANPLDTEAARQDG